MKAILSKKGCNLLSKYNLLAPLIQSILVDKLLEEVILDKEIEEAQLNSFLKANKLADESEFDEWLNQNSEDKNNILGIIMKPLKLTKFCAETYSQRAKNRFLERKTDLDEVVYSLIRVSDPFRARELYMQIKEGEAEFSKIAKNFSEGIESRSCGIIGPTPITKAHPLLSEILKSTNEGELREPMQIGEFILIVRVEKFINAVFDESMNNKMCKELFDESITKKVKEKLTELTNTFTDQTNNKEGAVK